MSFELRAREKIATGERWSFRCSNCGLETCTVIGYRDPVRTDYELKCSCGVQEFLVTGHARFGKDLLEAI